MKTSTQLNALVRNLAKEKNIGAEIVLRNYMLERLLERISLSAYNENFILKGSMLIAAMVGLDTRTTMDLDATLRGQNLSKMQIASIFQEVLSVEIDDNVIFTFGKIEETREDSKYPGYRLTFEARMDHTRQTLKVDITTGDPITPREIEYHFNLIFENRTIRILAYNLETVLAEKIESVLVRGVTNTRMRDFYDMYILSAMQGQNIEQDIFERALYNTALKRGSLPVLPKAETIIRTIAFSTEMYVLWERYRKNYYYAENIGWDATIIAVKDLIDKAISIEQIPVEAKRTPSKKDRGAR